MHRHSIYLAACNQQNEPTTDNDAHIYTENVVICEFNEQHLTRSQNQSVSELVWFLVGKQTDLETGETVMKMKNTSKFRQLPR